MSGCGAVTGGGGHHKNWNRGKLAAALVGWWWWQLCQESIPLYQRQNSYRIPNFIAINIPILGLSWYYARHAKNVICDCSIASGEGKGLIRKCHYSS